MFIYKCCFWYDNGATWEKRKEIIVNDSQMALEEIKEFLYATKYNQNDDIIDKLQVDTIDYVSCPTIL